MWYYSRTGIFNGGIVMPNEKIPIGIILSAKDIGKAIRTKRKSDGLTPMERGALRRGRPVSW